MKLPERHESGQAILIVLLSMAVVLTISLYIVSRTVTDISLSGSEEESQRAFSAAEAGIERALIVGTDIGITQLGEASFKAQVTGFAEGARQVAYPYPLLSGESANIWFMAHDEDGNLVCSVQKPCFTGQNLKLCWGNSGTPVDGATPAVELSVFYTSSPGDYSQVKIARIALDPNAGRRSLNFFSTDTGGTCQVDSDSYAFQKTFTLSSLGIPAAVYNTQGGLLFGSLKFFYNSETSHKFGVDAALAGNSLLPSQGMKIDSAGTSGAANRRVEVFQAFAEAPSIFSSVVFSGGGVTK